MRYYDDDILFWPPAFCFGQPATSPNYSGIAISLKKMVFFYFPSVFLRNSSPCGAFRFLDQRPKTLDSWKVPQVPNGFGKSHYYSRYSTADNEIQKRKPNQMNGQILVQERRTGSQQELPSAAWYYDHIMGTHHIGVISMELHTLSVYLSSYFIQTTYGSVMLSMISCVSSVLSSSPSYFPRWTLTSVFVSVTLIYSEGYSSTYFSVPRPETENSKFLEGSTGSERFRQKSLLLLQQVQYINGQILVQESRTCSKLEWPSAY